MALLIVTHCELKKVGIFYSKALSHTRPDKVARYILLQLFQHVALPVSFSNWLLLKRVLEQTDRRTRAAAHALVRPSLHKSSPRFSPYVHAASSWNYLELGFGFACCAYVYAIYLYYIAYRSCRFTRRPNSAVLLLLLLLRQASRSTRPFETDRQSKNSTVQIKKTWSFKVALNISQTLVYSTVETEMDRRVDWLEREREREREREKMKLLLLLGSFFPSFFIQCSAVLPTCFWGAEMWENWLVSSNTTYLPTRLLAAYWVSVCWPVEGRRVVWINCLHMVLMWKL